MRTYSVLVLTPSGVANPALAIAACRAGAFGILDLEYTNDSTATRAALERLERFTTSDFGVKVGRDAGTLLPQLLAKLPARLSCVVLAGGEHPDLATILNLLRN